MCVQRLTDEQMDLIVGVTNEFNEFDLTVLLFKQLIILQIKIS